MGWQYTPFTVPLALSVAVSLATLAYVVRRANYRLQSRLVTLYVLLAVGVVVWSTSYAIQLSSTSLAAKLLWNDAVWVGVTLVALMWVLFVFEYVGVTWIFRPRWVAAIAAVPVTTLVAAWSNSSHALLLSDPHLVTTTGGMLVLAFDIGPVYALHLLVTLSLDVARF